MARKTGRKKQKVTQSYKLYALLSKRARTRNQIAQALKVNPVSVGGYIFDLNRLYGVRVRYDRDAKTYALKNRVKIPRAGVRER